MKVNSDLNYKMYPMNAVLRMYSFIYQGLISCKPRIDMIRLALKGNELVRISTWETEQENWTRSRAVLDAHSDHMQTYLKKLRDETLQGSTCPETRPSWISENVSTEDLTNAGLLLLCGDDLLESFSTPGLWNDDDVRSNPFEIVHMATS